MDPTDGRVIRSFKAAGYRPHGLAWEGDWLWCVETNDRAFYKHDPMTGELLEKIVIDGPEPHGMTRRDRLDRPDVQLVDTARPEDDVYEEIAWLLAAVWTEDAPPRIGSHRHSPADGA